MPVALRVQTEGALVVGGFDLFPHGRCQLRPRAEVPANGFLTFGDAPTDEKLVKCGLFIGGNYAAIYEGTYPSADVAKQTMPLRPDQTYEILVRVDLATRTVELTVGEQRLVKKLSRNIQSIHYYGYTVITTQSEFTPIEIRER